MRDRAKHKSKHKRLSIWSLVIATLGLLDVHAGWAAPPQLPGWELAWFDEFDGGQVDNSLWNVAFSTNPTNNSLHAYLPQQVTVADGNLVITSDNQPYGSLPYRSGLVSSTRKQQYGRWEVRAKLPTSRGMWPAIWLLPDHVQYPWPSQGEIDIMENRGDQPSLIGSAFHYGTNPPYSHDFVYQDQQAVHGGMAQNYHDSFHTYAAEWEPSQVRFYVDGVHHYTVHDSDVGGFLSQQTAEMTTIINTAVGGDFLDNPDGRTIWPQQFLIDYVHVYNPAETPAPLTFENGGFETGNGTLADWSVFGNALPNVQGNTQAVRSGNSSLKVYGQFNGGENFSGVAQGITVTPGEELRAIARSFVRSGDSIAGTNNELILKVDYYNERHGKFNSPAYLGSDEIILANGSSSNNVWLDNELRTAAPTGAVEARLSLVFRQPNHQGGAVHVDDVLFGRRGDYTLSWDELGDGNWNDQRWIGAALDKPTDFDRALIQTNRVSVTGNQAAFETTVRSGLLDIEGTLTSDVTVETGGTLTASGTAPSAINGSLNNRGTQLVQDLASRLSVIGDADVDGAKLLISELYQQTRGTMTGDTLLLTADVVIGTFATPAGAGENSHLGDGHFLHDITHATSAVLVDIYAALPGDANGDLTVDGQDFIVWNNYKFQTGTDWLSGDFNGDGITDGSDFIVWNDNKFTSIDLNVVPEPSRWGSIWLLIVLLGRSTAWHRTGSQTR